MKADNNIKDKGTFDGNGKTISGLIISNTETLTEYAECSVSSYYGLFGYVFRGTVKNVALKDSSICVSLSQNMSGSVYSGGIAGMVFLGTVCDCANSGDVNVTTSHDYTYVGGITGYINGGTASNCTNSGYVDGVSSENYAIVGGVTGYCANECTIDGCTNSGNVNATAPNQNANAGGIIGAVYESCAISDCTNTGTIHATGYFRADVGGIAAEVNFGNTISACSNTGEVVATAANASYPYAYAGGIAGQVDASTVYDCANSGDTSAIASDGSHAGGIAGYVTRSGYDTESSQIDNCTNSGKIKATADHNTYAGGIAGDSYDCTLSNSKNYADVSAITADGYAFAGGITGSLATDGLISACTSNSTISAEASVQACTGGIVGFAGSSTLSDCGSNCMVHAAASDRAYAGGIVGITSSYRVIGCYSTSTIAATAADAYIGGIAGENANQNSMILGCVYLTYDGADFTNDYGSTMSAAQFASGEVTWWLNGGLTDGTQLWYQTLGVDAYPVLDNTHSTVNYDSDTGSYYNDADDAPTAPATSGDLNGDGEVNASDLTILARHVGKVETIEDEAYLANADVTGDGSVDASDLTRLAQYVGKIISSLD